jgi:hypothetical protein
MDDARDVLHGRKRIEQVSNQERRRNERGRHRDLVEQTPTDLPDVPAIRAAAVGWNDGIAVLRRSRSRHRHLGRQLARRVRPEHASTSELQRLAPPHIS